VYTSVVEGWEIQYLTRKRDPLHGQALSLRKVFDLWGKTPMLDPLEEILRDVGLNLSLPCSYELTKCKER
jgi:hypothetical protein